MDTIDLVVLLTAILVYLWYNYYRRFEINGIVYKTAKAGDDEKAAQILDSLNTFVIEIMAELKRDLAESNIPAERVYFVKNIIKKYNPTRIYEGLPNGEDTSFVIDKGEKLVLCLRDRHMKFHDLSLLKFVILHEISHIGSIGIDHDNEFWSNFRWLLRYTANKQLYVPVDYSANPVEYCKNIMLSDNPYFDEN